MTLLTVPWPLPKASVEYAWVQPHKLQLSALKSVGSPTQQMGRGSERKLTERERAEKRKLVWLIFNGWKINQISSLFASPLQRRRQEGVFVTLDYVRALTLFSALMRAHACSCLCTWIWKCFRMCVCKCFCECLSISFCLKLWTVARQLWQRQAQRSGWTDTSTCLWFLISGTGQHRYITRSESHQAKRQSVEMI